MNAPNLCSIAGKALVALASLTLSCSAPAADQPQSYPFPLKMAYTPTQIKQQFGITSDRNDPNPALHYQVMTPLNWEQVEVPSQLITPTHPVQQQCWLKSTTGPEAEMRVIIIYTPQEIDPSDWLALHLREAGERILNAKYYPQECGQLADVLSISTTPGPKRISRWMILKDGAPQTGGAHLFLLHASTSESAYSQELADVFGMAVTHFDVLHPTRWPYAEQLRTLVRAVPAKVATAFPLSWQQRENPDSDEHFYQVKLTKDLNGRRIGQVNLMLTAGQSEAEMRRLEEESRQGYQQADHLSFAPAHFEPAPKFGTFDQVFTALTPQTEVPAGTPAQERQVLLARAGTYWVLLENTRFTQQASPEAWAISKRGFEIVQEHLVVKP